MRSVRLIWKKQRGGEKGCGSKEGEGVRIGSAHEFTGGFAPVFCK
ncbi:hypothetical protein HMPREF1548_06251 [Clostridium sp. KLE 1755]|nr:hypothetical protein HMPREF1548_06251 [Clostridium sp. KLE 1755]